MNKDILIEMIQEKITNELEVWKEQLLDDVENRFYSIKDALYDNINEAIIEASEGNDK